MAQLTFTYEQGYISSVFDGGVTLQLIFAEAGKHVIFLESRLGESMPWALLKKIVVEPMSFIKVREPSDGQQYRIISAFEPTFAMTSPITGTPGSSSGNKEKVGSEDIENGSIKLEDLSDEVKDKLIGDGWTEQDEENVWFPPLVTNITADTTGENVVLVAEAENIDEDEDVTWELTFDSEEPLELESTGTVLELTTAQTQAFHDAVVVSVKLFCSDYESEPYTVKADAAAAEGESSGDGPEL